jgi:phenylacetate-coenzyme A ligase PaaK-like adenylate-forming protein
MTLRTAVSQWTCLLRRRRELRSHERWSREELVWFQGEALARLRRHAYENSPFYRDFHEGFREAPLD